MDIKEMIVRAKRGEFNLKEFLTRSEGPELFTDVLNTKLMEGFNGTFNNAIESIYDSVNISEGRQIRFPSVRGINPDFVPELGEYQRADWEITGVSVEVAKFGVLIGMSREMIDDNQVGLIGMRAKMAGAAHRELLRNELAKCISVFSTGPAVSTGVLGFSDHGERYPGQGSPAGGGYTNFFSATALNWETIIAQSRRILWSQRVTITAKGIDMPFPVIPDFLLANPHHEMDVRKVVQASIVVGAGGISLGNNATNVAGTNIFQNIISNLIFDPTVPTGQCVIGASKKGAVIVRKDNLELEEYQNFYFDANDMKTRERFKPAIIEDRYFVDVQMSA